MEGQPVPQAARSDVEAFRRDGHVRLRAVFDAVEIARLRAALAAARETPQDVSGEADAQLSRDTFLSRSSPEVAAFALHPRLGALAAALLGARGIRLIHDVALEKAPEHASTPWHRDSDFWSFEGAGALTFWIPLQETPVTMSPLSYATRSHLSRDRRPLLRREKALIPLRFPIATSALNVGDVAVHHYETLHGAGRNRERLSRYAFAVHVIDAEARFRVSSGAGHIEHAGRCGWDRLNDGDRFPDAIAPLIYRVPASEPSTRAPSL